MSKIDKEFAEILKTEYSVDFDEKRKAAMVNSYYRYGKASENYGVYKCLDARANILERLKAYEETKNKEFLVDVANFAMLEYMFPSIEGAFYKPTGKGAVKTIGHGIEEIRREAEGLKD